MVQRPRGEQFPAGPFSRLAFRFGAVNPLTALVIKGGIA